MHYLGVVAIAGALFLKVSVHQIPEGHVGVYWRGGKLLTRITGPGMHLRVPFLDHFEAIQVTMQTDKVMDIPCGTKTGVNITFEKIEVVNRLQREHVYETIREYGVHYDKTWIYDKIHHEINQFCSSHTLQDVFIDKFDQVDDKIRATLQADCNRYAPGIEIISVRVTKPRIPESIMGNYVAMEVERTKVLVAAERRKVVELETEMERVKAVAEAEKKKLTSQILQKQLLLEREAQQQQEAISNQLLLARHKALADAEFYRMSREAEAHRLKLTPEFLEFTFLSALNNNTKVFFGEKLPHMVLDQRLLRGVFDEGAKGRRLHQEQQQQQQEEAQAP